MNAHINALLINLSNERARLSMAKTQAEIDLRTVWVRQLEREVKDEETFIEQVEITDDELLSLLDD